MYIHLNLGPHFSDTSYHSLDDLTVAAGKAIFSLKSDEASLQDRYSTQDRHLNVIMSSLAEEITAIKAAIHSIAHDMPLVVNCCAGDDYLRQTLPFLQEQLELCQKSLTGRKVILYIC